MEGLLYFAALGAIGGILKVLLHTESLAEALRYDKIRCIMVGAIIGLAYYFLYTDHNFPNSFMALISGYSGANFIDYGSKKLNKLLQELLKP